MRRLKFAILISILLIGGIVLLRVWVSFKSKAAKDEEIPKVSTLNADMQMEKIRFVEDKHGRKTWELEAKSAQQYQDQNVMTLEDVKVTFYAQDGRTFIVTGNRAKVHQDSKDLELSGDVTVTSSDGYRLKTHSVSYRNSERRVTSADPVVMEGELIRLAGRGMLVDLETKTLKVLHDVKTQWRGGKKG